ncbi:Signal transducer regulating beta-lactamase production, contains metallopeptidase domain [Butyrivibrio proteoclasticus]|uniref:Signal transducer regulating beta-lactamase production, contains metallopeptidase domain n=1 Tax=Butyrivibrio proteoclasticus TaxID=43305 RepID=A0A1I5UEP6_9FIRM|nr:M56 family metallopeptidase [Butyrivibrio proteoclasticus]SFP93688.1 Signal transducer regulating beta-lactamase production, contains metallopeptidase domain [Butyrivibrio proteoclasticus]
MGLIFIKVIEMSMASILLMIAVSLIRIPLKKAPKWFMGVLWAVVALRLLVPLQIQSDIGFMPDFGKIVNVAFSKGASTEKNLDTLALKSVGVMADVYADDISFSNAGDDESTVTDTQNTSIRGYFNNKFFVGILIIWLLGVVAVLGYAVFSYIRIYLKTRISIRFSSSERVFVCDEIDTPFIFGMLRPIVYLPSDLDHKTIENVLAHELVHIKRCDHIRKQLGYLIVAIHWFNPLVWLSYILFCRDIELACDEMVISNMSSRQKKSYANSLLLCSTRKRFVTVYPTAFGEVGVATRVRQILNYKKPSFYLIMVLIIVTSTLLTCSFTRAADKVIIKPYTLQTLKDNSNDADRKNDDGSGSVKAKEPVHSVIFTDGEIEVKATGDGLVNLPYTDSTKKEITNLPYVTGNETVVEINEHEGEQTLVDVKENETTVHVSGTNDSVSVNVSGSTASVEVKDTKETVHVEADVSKTLEPVDTTIGTVNTIVNENVKSVAPEVVSEVVNEVANEVVDEVVNEVVNDVVNETVNEVAEEVFDEAGEVDEVINTAFSTIDSISSLFGR